MLWNFPLYDTVSQPGHNKFFNPTTPFDYDFGTLPIERYCSPKLWDFTDQFWLSKTMFLSLGSVGSFEAAYFTHFYSSSGSRPSGFWIAVRPFFRIEGLRYTQFYFYAKLVTFGKLNSYGLSIYLGSSALLTNMPFGTMVQVVWILTSWHLS